MNERDRTRFDEDAEPAGAFRLRSEAPPVMRLSRRVLTGLVGIGAIVIFAALIFAMSQGGRRSGGGSELYNTDNKTTPDGLTNLPRDYGGLTPDKPLPANPLSPGEAGRPQPVLGLNAIDPEQQRLAQENEAARLSRLFATTGTRERPAEATPDAPVADTKTAPGQGEAAPLDPGALLNMQDRKLAFVNGAVDRKTVSPDHLENPVSRYVVQAGSVIAAALITGMRSDLPGEVTAQVTENVYDSPTGRYLLIPQGSKLLGTYDSQVAFGQNRLLLVWTRLMLPNGRSIVLERQPGADPQGFIGLEDGVDQHWDRLFMGAVLSTVIGIGAELGSNANDSAIASAATASVRQVSRSHNATSTSSRLSPSALGFPCG